MARKVTSHAPIRLKDGEQPVRVGFLGAGLIARSHADGLLRSGESISWTGVYDPDHSRSEQFAATTGAVVRDSVDAVLDNCDAVYVCTWTSAHKELVEKAAAGGVAIFCEKPLYIDISGARQMHAAVRRARVPNQVGLVLRSSPSFLKLRELVQDPASGPVMSIVFRDDQFIPIRGHYASTWRADVARAGAGTLLEHSIHDLDLLEWIGGKVEAVSAKTANFHAHPGIEDVATTTLTYAGGATASLTSVWHDIDSRPSLRRVEVFCQRAWFALEGDWNGPVRAMRDGNAEVVYEQADLQLAAQALDTAQGNPDKAFIRTVRTGSKTSPDFADAVRAQQLADAAYRSASSGRAISVA